MLLLSATALNKDNETWMHLLLRFALHSSDCSCPGVENNTELIFKLCSALIFKMFPVTPLLGLERISGALGVLLWAFCNFCFYGGKNAFLQNATHSTSKLTGTSRHNTEGWLETAKGKQKGQRGITSMTKNDRQKGEEVVASSPGKGPCAGRGECQKEL